MPALAVVGADHRIVRSTETFRRQCNDAAALCDRSPEIDLVLNGQTDTAVVNLGELRVAIEAVTDGAGKRQAMLSLPGGVRRPDPETSVVAIREAAADSPALVWVKDLDGRYLCVNLRFEHYLETSRERLCGSTDADLPAGETVDGPRLRYIEDGLQEPLALEYTVPAYESRPSMAAFRFPLRNRTGEPIATCGVAAPTSEPDVARDEAVRLMQLERWNHLDPGEVRAELLEQWHVQATSEPAPVVLEADPDEPAHTPQDERAAPSASAAPPLEADAPRPARETTLQDLHVRLREAEAQARQAAAATTRAERRAERYRSELEAAKRELGAARARSESLRAPSDAAARLSEELGRALAAERERGDELARVLARVRSRLGDFEGALERSKSATDGGAAAGARR